MNNNDNIIPYHINVQSKTKTVHNSAMIHAIRHNVVKSAPSKRQVATLLIDPVYFSSDHPRSCGRRNVALGIEFDDGSQVH